MEPSFIFVLVFVSYALEKNVGFVGFGDRHHLKIFILISNDLRERKLANFTFKFCEVVALNNSLDLFFYFTVYPSFEASNMDQSTTSFAITRRN